MVAYRWLSNPARALCAIAINTIAPSAGRVIVDPAIFSSLRDFAQTPRRFIATSGISFKMAEAVGLTNEEAAQLCKPAEAATKDFIFQQTMYRIKDPRKTLPFYTGVLGMTLLQKLDFPQAQFTLYFMGYENPADVPKDDKERTRWAMSRKAMVELTHNWGTENDADQAYHNGNSDPRGFGHIGLMVPDVYAACKRFEENGVEFVKKPDDGRMKGLAFIKDPDGYWIEIFNANTVCN